jgi:hypothetical protein
MESGPVFWIGPAVKTGQQLVGQIGDNPCIVSDFGVGHNAKNRAFATAKPRQPRTRVDAKNVDAKNRE